MATTVTATTKSENNEKRIESTTITSSSNNNNNDIITSIKLPIDRALNVDETLEPLEHQQQRHHQQPVTIVEASISSVDNRASNSMATTTDSEDEAAFVHADDDDDDPRHAGSDAEQAADTSDDDITPAYNSSIGGKSIGGEDGAGSPHDGYPSWHQGEENMFNDYMLNVANATRQNAQADEQFPAGAEHENYYSEAGGTGSNGADQQQQLQLSSGSAMGPGSPASVCYSDDSIPEMKYTPNEYIMQPPASSTMHYNYQQLQQPPHLPPPPHTPYHGIAQQQQHAHHSQQPPHHPHHGYAQRYHNLPHGPPGLHGRVPQLQYAHHPSGYYPNMWYPNAPYGTSARFHNQYGGHPSYGHAHPHHPAHHHYPGYPHDPMLEMLQLSNSGREARNRAEKNRRDKLNGSIQELSTMVPHVAESPKRVDKTAVLRFAAHGLRLNYIFGNSVHHERPLLTDALMSLLDSFFLTLTCHGQIVLISNSIEQHLGHCQADLYGQNILQITHPEDHSLLKQKLIPDDLENLFDVHPDDDNGEPRPRTQAEEDYIDKRLREDKRSFTVRLARAGPRSEPTTYEIVKIDGCFRRSDAAPRGIKSNTFISSLQLIRRSRGRDDTIPLHTISGNDIVLVAVARIIGPPKIIHRPMESKFLEYKTRHLIDGRIIDCDQRISLVAGYMRDEVQNLSPFTFIHQDDVRWVIVALRQMYDCNSSYGESTYRLYTRNRNFIYLQTKGYLEIDKDTNKVHSFVCINTLLDEAEGKRCVQEMKNKFSVFIKTKIPQSTTDAPAAEHPQQLEKAVMCLIQNLQKSPSDDDDDQSTSSFSYDSQGMHSNNASAAHLTRQTSRLSTHRGSSKTPPLALVPPEPSTIKSTISKSLCVVNVTPAKASPKSDEQVAMPVGVGDPALRGMTGACACAQQNNVERCVGKCSSTLARNENNLKRRTCSEHEVVARTDNAEMVFPKRRLKSSEIENVLASSLNQIERSLNHQWNTANELRDCGNKYQIPNANERIDEILEEHQEQSEIYLNIKSEYEVQRQNMTSTTKNETDPQINAKELRPS